MRNRRPILLLYAGVLLGFIATFFLFRRSKNARKTESQGEDRPFSLQGLSQVEAVARYREGQSNAIHIYPPQTRREMIRKNTFTVFNTGLVAIIFVQILLTKYLDALLSFGVLLFTVGVNVFQEEFARIRLQNIQEAAQPKAIVIRDGQLRSINPDHIVIGDVVEFSIGDQIMVDGRLLAGKDVLVDESAVFGTRKRRVKKPGDTILAGSLCLQGRGAMVTTHIDEERLIVKQHRRAPASQEAFTPIEKIIDRILKWLLAFVIVIAAILLFKYFSLRIALSEEQINQFIDAIGVIFSIAPASLFFMISLTYAAATVDLSKLRVLINRARSIETLAQIDMMCFNKEGFLTGEWLTMKPVDMEHAEKGFSDMELRHLLGTFARSVSHPNRFTRTMQTSFEGLKLPPAEEMPFFAHFGWMGIRLDEGNVQGVLILGTEDRLNSLLKTSASSPEQERIITFWKGTTGKLGKVFDRFRKDTPSTQPEKLRESPTPAPVHSATENPEVNSQGILNKVRRRALRVFLRDRQNIAQQPTVVQEEASLLFAWSPTSISLFDETGHPRLPEQLIPLCHLSYQQRANPDAVKALRAFSMNGVASKIFHHGPVDEIRTALQQAGAPDDLIQVFRGISGHELQHHSAKALAEAVMRHHLIGDASPELMERSVKALREQGHLVGVVGSHATELDAMMAADLSVTAISGSSGALSIADIVLLDTSPTVITAMLDKGQRIVNGLLDVLKLYLTQAFYLLMLVGALLIFLRSFPYRGAQGGLIAALAISVPAVALTLTAPPGRLHTKNLGRSLFTFVIPASISITLAGFWLFSFFLWRYGDNAYAQIALVHALMGIGLFLVILLRPPITFQHGRLLPHIRFSYFIPAIVSVISGLIFLAITFIPLAQKFLYISPLRSWFDYLLVAGVALGWAAVFGFYLLLTFLVRQFSHRW